MTQNEIKSYSDLAAVLATNTKILASDRGAEAREIAGYQVTLWPSLISHAIFANDNDLNRQAIAMIKDILGQTLRRRVPTTDTGADGQIVNSPLPVLTLAEADVIVRLAQGDRWAVWAALLERVWQLIAGDRDNLNSLAQDPIARLFSDPRMIGGLARFQADVAHERTAGALRDRTQGLLDLAGDQVEELIADSRVQVEKAVTAASSAAHSIEQLSTTVDDERKRRGEDFDAFMAQARADIEAARKEATETGVLRSATQLWRGKARLHALSFWLGLAAIVALVGYALDRAYLYGPAFVAGLPKRADGEVTYIVVALLIICAIAAGWILRFIGRFVIENMVMQTDAAQRRVMLETYLALVGSKDARMEQADRTLILNAIFRPLPGHQSEDIAPPTLAEVIKSAATGGKPG